MVLGRNSEVSCIYQQSVGRELLNSKPARSVSQSAVTSRDQELQRPWINSPSTGASLASLITFALDPMPSRNYLDTSYLSCMGLSDWQEASRFRFGSRLEQGLTGTTHVCTRSCAQNSGHSKLSFHRDASVIQCSV